MCLTPGYYSLCALFGSRACHCPRLLFSLLIALLCSFVVDVYCQSISILVVVAICLCCCYLFLLSFNTCSCCCCYLCHCMLLSVNSASHNRLLYMIFSPCRSPLHFLRSPQIFYSLLLWQQIRYASSMTSLLLCWPSCYIYISLSNHLFSLLHPLLLFNNVDLLIESMIRTNL